MKINLNINITDKTLYVFYFSLFCLIISITVYASNMNHTSESLLIDTASGEMTLQEAVDTGVIGGPGSMDITFIPPKQIYYYSGGITDSGWLSRGAASYGIPAEATSIIVQAQCSMEDDEYNTGNAYDAREYGHISLRKM